MVLPFWYWLTQVVLEKRPLNGCSSRSSSSSIGSGSGGSMDLFGGPLFNPAKRGNWLLGCWFYRCVYSVYCLGNIPALLGLFFCCLWVLWVFMLRACAFVHLQLLNIW